MGSTVTCAKRAAAFRAGDKVFYVLFESTYESNVYPHTPSWSCVSLGDAAATLRRIFCHASSCEGGMLKTRSGRITPEGYITGWLKQLASPLEMPNLTIALRVTQSYRSPVPPGALDELAPLLAAHGRPDGSEMLRGGGEVLLQLYADAELLGAMCNDLISPWRLIRAEYMPPDGEPRHDLGYRPPPVRTTDPSLPLFRQLGDDYLMQQPDGSWRSAGWAYRIIGKYVEQYWTVELTQPGSYRRRIGRFRDAVHTAPAMPPGTRVALTPANARTEYTRSRIDKILAMSPRPPDGAPLEVMPNSENLYDLCNLDPACAVWILPGSSPPDLPSAGQPSPA